MADESALRDGNRNPTLLFEHNGEVRRVSNTNPLPVTATTGPGGPTEVTGVGGEPVQVAGNIGINGTIPVSGTVSLPPDTTLTETREQTGSIANFTLLTPVTGKRLQLKGFAIVVDALSGYEAGIRLASGKVLHKVFRSDQAGNYVISNYLGGVNEALAIYVTGVGGGTKSFFQVNYNEM